MNRVVVCAAIRFGRVIVCAPRHFDSTMHAMLRMVDTQKRPACPSDWEQGFVDQFGFFLTREEAWPIALAAGQIKRRVGGDEEVLYSENLY